MGRVADATVPDPRRSDDAIAVAMASVLLQKSLAHSAMDAYIGVHGYYDQEVAIATGGSTDSRVLGAVSDAASAAGGTSQGCLGRLRGRIESRHRCVRGYRPGHGAPLDAALRSGGTRWNRERPTPLRPTPHGHPQGRGEDRPEDDWRRSSARGVDPLDQSADGQGPGNRPCDHLEGLAQVRTQAASDPALQAFPRSPPRREAPRRGRRLHEPS